MLEVVNVLEISVVGQICCNTVTANKYIKPYSYHMLTKIYYNCIKYRIMKVKGIINIESVWRRSLKALGYYYIWLFYKEKTNPTEKMLQMRALYSDFVKQGDLCFDIGANMGSRVNSFLALGAKVIALEPNKECIRELEKVYKNYPLTLVQKGVGAVNEVKEFYIASNTLMSSFSKEWIDTMRQKHKKDRWDNVEQIEIITLDTLIEKYGKPDFIKIDTEGFEQEVLKGLSTPIKALSFEYTLPDPQKKALECLSLVDKLYSGKALYNICKDEDYKMHFSSFVTAGELEKLLSSDSFNDGKFGNYGDIYVKRV